MEKLDKRIIEKIASIYPEGLGELLNVNFLPPPQMIVCIDAIKKHLDDEKLANYLIPLLGHWSSAVVEVVKTKLDIQDEIA